MFHRVVPRTTPTYPKAKQRNALSTWGTSTGKQTYVFMNTIVDRPDVRHAFFPGNFLQIKYYLLTSSPPHCVSLIFLKKKKIPYLFPFEALENPSRSNWSLFHSEIEVHARIKE